jgi:hypothetical protein
MMRASRLLVALAAVAVAGACDPRRQEIEPGELTVAPADREPWLERNVMIEGTPEPLRFRLLSSPAWFQPRFSTYVPEDMEEEFRRLDEGGVVHITARFGGLTTERARLSVHTHAPGTTVEQAQSELAAYLASLFPDDTPETRDAAYDRDMPITPLERYPWASHESQYRVPGAAPGEYLVGHAGVGVHGEHVFHFIIEYPEEFGDGMGPRVAVVLDEWRWEDTGEHLTR